jgi:serine/threonine protein phosphatase PrpC
VSLLSPEPASFSLTASSKVIVLAHDGILSEVKNEEMGTLILNEGGWWTRKKSVSEATAEVTV